MADWLANCLTIHFILLLYFHMNILLTHSFSLLNARISTNIQDLNPFLCKIFSPYFRQMHDEVSETENLRKNLAVERMIVEGCDILLDVNQVFVRQGELCAKKKSPHSTKLFSNKKRKKTLTHTHTSFFYSPLIFINVSIAILINCKYEQICVYL